MKAVNCPSPKNTKNIYFYFFTLLALLVGINSPNINAQPSISGSADACANECITYTASNGIGPYHWQVIGGTAATTIGDNTLICWNNVLATNITLTDTGDTSTSNTASLAVTVNANPSPEIILPPYPSCSIPSIPCPIDSIPPPGWWVGANDMVITFLGGTVTIDPLANDFFIDDIGIVEGYEMTELSQPCNGVATFDPEGTVVYVPNPGFVGIDNFTYTVCTYLSDGSASCEVVAIITIEVLDENGTENGVGNSCITTCQNTTATYSTANNTGSTYTWLVEGAVSFTETDNEVTVTWGNNETAYLQVVESNALGCLDSVANCVEILPAPSAAFSTNPPVGSGSINICNGQTVYFSPNENDALSYLWDFGDGTTADHPSAAHTYTDAGTYTASLITTSACNCSDTSSVEIIVDPAQIPNIDCVSTTCAGEIGLYGTDASCGTYNWVVTGHVAIVEGGGPSDPIIAVEWGDGPIGTIELSVTDCDELYCADAAFVEVPIIPATTSIDGPTVVCKGELTGFSVPLFGATEYTWTLDPAYGNVYSGQGTDQIQVTWSQWTASGTTTEIQVAYENCFLGCSGTAVLEVTISSKFALAEPFSVCENGSSYISAFEMPAGWPTVPCDWNITLPDGTVQTNSYTNVDQINHTWDAGPGTYFIEAIAVDPNAYCNTSAAIVVVVEPLPAMPTAIEGPTVICANSAYAYEATASSITGNFTWLINNGGTITSQTGNPISVLWGSTPPYSLDVLQSTSLAPICYSDTLSVDLNLLASPSITGNDELCNDQVGTYSTTAIPGENFNWQITPASAGNIVAGNNSESVDIHWILAGNHTVELNLCGQAASFNVNVLPLPEPEVVAPDGLCFGESTTLSLTQNYASYVWQDTIGIISTGPTADITNGGNFYVEVTDDNGCVNGLNFAIDTYPFPEVYISTPDLIDFCSGLLDVTIYASEGVPPYDYQWYLDDVPFGSNDAVIEMGAYGTYHVVVTNENGCTNISNDLVLTEDLSLCGGGQCTGGKCPIPGVGCESDGILSFDYVPENGMCQELAFSNTNPDAIPGTFLWTFDDPNSSDNSSNLENPLHLFWNPGFYWVTMYAELPAISPPGTTCNVGIKQVVAMPLRANFYVYHACEGMEVRMEDLSTHLPNPDGEIVSWEWDFGDLSTTSDVSTDQNPTYVYSAPGIYDVALIVTDASGCTAVMTQDAFVYPLPTAQFNAPTTSCENVGTPFLASPNPDAVSYEWDFDDPTSGAANTSANEETWHTYTNVGTYDVTLTVTDVYGCSGTFTQSINITPNNMNGDIGPAASTTICEGETTSLTAPTGESYLWSNGLTTETIEVTTTGNYSVTVTNADGCEYIPSQATVLVNNAPNTTITANNYNTGETLYHTADLCLNEDLSLGLSYIPNNTYLWSDASGTTATFLNLQSNTLGVGTHTYTATVTDEIGCSAVSEPFTIIVHPNPNAFIYSNPSSTPCEGSPIDLIISSPAPDFSYYWNTGETSEQITTAEAGIYYVTAITEYGCTTTSNTITVHPLPDTSNVPAGCYADCGPIEICLPPMPAVAAYQWYLDDVAIPAPEGTQANLSATQTGVYYVELTSDQGCMATSEPLDLLVFTPPSLSLVSLQDAGCGFTGSITVATTGGTEPYTYSWSHDAGLNSTLADGLLPNNYSVTVTDANDCTDVLSEIVTGTDDLILNIIPTDVTCGGANGTATVQVAGGNAPYTYSWDDPSNQTTETAVDLAIGNYNVFVSDASGCVNSLGIDIVGQSGPVVSISAVTDATCGQADGSISITTFDGNPPYNYIWDTGTIVGDFATGLAGGTYQVTVTDFNGCTDELSIEVLDSAGITVNLDAVTAATCGTDDGTATVSVSGGSAPYTYAWSHDATITDFAATNLPAGETIVTVTDAQGCNTNLSIDVPTTEPSLVVTCGDASSGDVAFVWNTVLGATGYEISYGPNTDTTTDTTYVVTGIPAAGSVTLNVTPIFATPCTVASVSATCTGGACPELSLGIENLSDTYCGEETPLTLIGIPTGGTFTINDVPATELAPSTLGLGTHEIDYSYIAPDFCLYDTTFVVNIVPTPIAAFDLSANEICIDEEVTATFTGTASAGATYSWNFGSDIYLEGDADQVISWNETGPYNVSLVVSEGACVDTFSIRINVIGFEIFTSGDTLINVGDSASISTQIVGLEPGEELLYNWIPTEGLSCTDCSNPTANPTETTTYTVVATDLNGCTATDEVTINVQLIEELPKGFNIPTAFSPNGDNINDVFKVIEHRAERVEFAVYNRWGEEVYHIDTTDFAVGWDGLHNGNICEMGVYVFFGRLYYMDGSVEKFKGNVTLIR